MISNDKSNRTILDLAEINGSLLSHAVKGIPRCERVFPLRKIGEKGWRVLDEDLTLPLAIINQGALRENSRWMSDYLRRTGARLAPHGKTTMAPQLFELQLQDGAWGVTASTSNHVAAYRRAGVSRILMANQLIGRQNINIILNELRSDPGFDFYCLIDSPAGLERLLDGIRENDPGRPLQLLLEVGMSGGRTGVRDVQDAVALARLVKVAGPAVTLRGVEAFEGIFDLKTENSTKPVNSLLSKVAEVARRCDEEGLFADDEIILTAGGSAYFDSAAEHFNNVALSRPVTTVLRSGCYLTHDSGFYTRAFERITDRNGDAREVRGALRPALEICAYIQSRPEAELAIANFGRRDASFDMDLPKPLWRCRPGCDRSPKPLDGAFSVAALNDQHAYIKVQEDSDIQVGDMMGFGISHPCTTFDKWKYLFLVDDDYTVIDAIKTFF